ncbi:plasmid-related protein, partial [Haematococcus lacustris]
MSGLGEDSFSPGLRVAFVEYCKMPVGQGRLHPFDPSAPKMSQSQFIKLLQDIGVAEPEGSVPISSISVVFASFKPLGGSRMLFPHFFRALGAISSEARQDVIQMVSALGSRAVDLQYLSSIRLFPDKQFPYVLSKGDVGTQAGSVPPPRPGPGGPVGLVQRPPGSAPQAFGTSGNVVPLPRAVPSPREVWRSGEFVPPQQQQAGGEVDGHPPSHAHDGYPPIQARALASQPDSSPSPESPSRATYGSTHITPANHRQLEAWGAWEPPRDNDGKVPGWLNYMFNKMEFLEAGLRNMAGKGLSEADKEALARGIEHTCTTTCVAAANDIVRPVVAHAMSLETQVAEALAKLDALTPLHGKLAAAVELNDKVQRIETNIGSVQTAVHDMSSQFNGDVSRIIAMVGMVSDKVHRVTDGQLPAMEDELKKLKGLDVAIVDALTKRVEVLEATAMRHDEELQALRAQLAQDAERLRTEMELNMAELRTNITTNTDSLKSNVEVNINEMHASIAANHDSLRAATAGTAEELRTELAISAEAANRDVAELQRLLQSSIAAHEQLAAKVASEELRNEELRKLIAASTGRLSEDAAVDRAGLLTTTNLVEQTCTALESLKAQVAALEKRTSTSDANPESLLQRLDAQEQKMMDVVADVTAMSASLADLKDKELVAMQQRLVLVEESDAAYSLSLKELQPAIPELQATAASLKAGQAGLDTRISGLEASMPRLLASVSDMEASVAGAAEKQETLAASVASVADKQAAVDAAVAAAADKQAAMEATITSAAVDATVAAAADKQAAMEATIAGLAGKSGEVAEAVAGLGSRVADMDSRMTGRTAAVSELGPPAETLEHSVATMSSGEGLPAIISKLSELEGAFTEMKQALEGSLAAVQGTVQDMQGGMAAVQGTVAALQGNVAEVQGGFAAMQGTIQEDMEGGVAAMQSTVQEVQGSLAAVRNTVLPEVQQAAVGNEQAIKNLEETAAGLQQSVDANLKRVLEDAAVDRAQVLGASTLIGQVFESLELLKPDVAASTSLGSTLKELLTAVARTKDLASLQPVCLTRWTKERSRTQCQDDYQGTEGGAAGMTPDSVTSSAPPAESQTRPDGNVAQAAELQALQAQMEGMKQQVQSLLEGVSKQAEDDEARHKSRLAELESARKDAKVALLTAVKAEQQAAADKLGSEMQALAAQLSSKVQALAARLEEKLSSADTAHDDLVGATAVTAQAGDDLVGASAATAQAEVVAAMATRLEGIERVLGVPVGSEAQAVAAAGKAGAAPDHAGSAAGSSAQDTAGSSGHGTDSGQGGQADGSRAMGT